MWVGLMLKLTSKRDNNKTGVTAFFVNFFMHSPRQYLNGQIIMVTLRPKVRPEFAIYTPKRDDEHPRHFYRGVPPGSNYRVILDLLYQSVFD